MRVNCLATGLSDEEKIVLGIKLSENPLFQLTVGSVYLVLGLACQVGYYAGPVIQVQDDFGKCIFVPICLFEVVDSRPSAHWVAKSLGKFELALWPVEFYIEYFHDDLSDGNPASVELFKGLVRKMEREFFE